MRIFPEMWANTLWPFSSSTRNMAFGRGSTTVPSRTIASSLGFGRVLLLNDVAGPAHSATGREALAGPTDHATARDGVRQVPPARGREGRGRPPTSPIVAPG